MPSLQQTHNPAGINISPTKTAPGKKSIKRSQHDMLSIQYAMASAEPGPPAAASACRSLLCDVNQTPGQTKRAAACPPPPPSAQSVGIKPFALTEDQGQPLTNASNTASLPAGSAVPMPKPSREFAAAAAQWTALPESVKMKMLADSKRVKYSTYNNSESSSSSQSAAGLGSSQDSGSLADDEAECDAAYLAYAYTDSMY